MADLIPVIKGTMGGRDYYVGKMTFQELAAKVQFYSKIELNPTLDEMLQRGISKRSKEMTEYLKRQPERFYGAIIVATWGGRPAYMKVKMEDHPLLDDDFEFGLLKFDGRQEYFALDGQHRLQSIKEAIEDEPDLRHEEVSVIFVTHERTEEGNIKTRRLFHTLNRYARPTTSGENIALDEDNVVSITTRMLLGSGICALRSGRVEVVRKNLLKAQTDKFTSLASLFDFNNAVLGSVYAFGADKDYLKFRPAARDVENVFGAIRSLWSEMVSRIPELKALEADLAEPGDFREPKGRASSGNLLFRPIGLKIFGGVLGRLISEREDMPLDRCEPVDEGLWSEVLEQVKPLPTSLGELPWKGTILRGEQMVTRGQSLALRLALYMLGLSVGDDDKLRRDYCRYLEDEGAVLPPRVV